ncbi:MAG: sigma-54-dependent Fis family transcriptional regulator [Gemmataceae bacterium]|nr:sigma-54-dependent Fis family transcriptional regulator [Gemmataceae bacterium]
MISVTLPVLRDRPEDIPLLVAHHLLTRRLGRVPMRVDPETMDVLVRYDWPGYIRELANVIGRAQILAEVATIMIDGLPENLDRTARPTTGDAAPESPDDLAVIERRHVAEVMGRTGGNRFRRPRRWESAGGRFTG